MIDHRIPLMIQQPNILAALDAGNTVASNQQNLLRQAEGQNLFREYGAAAMQGDQNALAQIGGFDPVMAQGMDMNRQENRRADERLGMAREQLDMARAETARAVREAQNRADAESQVRMMQQAFKAMDVGMRTGDMRAVTQGLTMFGLEELTPEEGMQVAAQMVAGGTEGLAQAYLPQAPYQPQSPEGKLQADINAGILPKPVPGQVPAAEPDDIDTFRREFSGLPLVKDFSNQSQAYGRIVAAATDPSPAGDMALIFNYMKLLDPGSTVREGEFATAQSATGVPGQIINLYNQVLSGTRLNDDQRTDFVGRAESLYKSAEQGFNSLRGQFETIAFARGYPVDQALINFGYSGPSYEPPPPVVPPPAATPAAPDAPRRMPWQVERGLDLLPEVEDRLKAYE
jgi:hypothetical protein